MCFDYFKTKKKYLMLKIIFKQYRVLKKFARGRGTKIIIIIIIIINEFV